MDKRFTEKDKDKILNQFKQTKIGYKRTVDYKVSDQQRVLILRVDLAIDTFDLTFLTENNFKLTSIYPKDFAVEIYIRKN